MQTTETTPLRGWVNTFYRDYKGRKLGPYHVRRWKVGTKIHREYIKPADVERVKAACQAHKTNRAKQKECSDWLTNTSGNLNYMMRMVKWSIKGKVRPQDIDFMNRLDQEGFAITGRPPTRRKVTHRLAIVEGQRVIVKTVFELDGTTKVFMVPFVINFFQNPGEWLKKVMDDAIEATRERQRLTSQTTSCAAGQ